MFLCYPVDALFSSCHGSLHLILSYEVSWDGPVELWGSLFLNAAQTRLNKKG